VRSDAFGEGIERKSANATLIPLDGQRPSLPIHQRHPVKIQRVDAETSEPRSGDLDHIATRVTRHLAGVERHCSTVRSGRRQASSGVVCDDVGTVAKNFWSSANFFA